jgi:hypothetical protein
MLSKLKQEQDSLSLEPVTKCGNPLCGWGFIYAEIWGVKRFPRMIEDRQKYNECIPRSTISK